MFRSAGIQKQYCTADLIKITTMTELQQHLTDNPQIETVYFNEAGEWLFSQHPSYPIAKNRDEVLGTVTKTSKKDK